MHNSSIRKQILRERGLTVTKPGKRKHRRLAVVPATSLDELKTPTMRYLELKFCQPIEELLLLGSLGSTAEQLGINFTTVFKWRKRLNLNYSPTNLPQCKGCPRRNKRCKCGRCIILYEMKEYDLAKLKKSQVLGHVV